MVKIKLVILFGKGLSRIMLAEEILFGNNKVRVVVVTETESEIILN